MAHPGLGKVAVSLFDRLTDEEPGNSREVPLPEGEQLRRYKESVARDLTCLLNSRKSEDDIPEEYKLTRESVAAYGVQDFTTAPTDREVIRKAIEKAVRTFEPRLSRVQVTIGSDSDFRCTFRISGMLRVETNWEAVAYDAQLPVESRRFQVVGLR